VAHGGQRRRPARSAGVRFRALGGDAAFLTARLLFHPRRC
jgi:hypothetical protein